ncbi:uncharacterized protein BO80DRAFT_179674 [Aspergillus ibericus CBS 121593]|uniref:Uncharacterized protein n=1 Tax=Aspergillus ibericus CBS 121593 TaxID=1448316 RepID=A0A395GQV1_9EURO|nr:hypothetical protein BO80DRAFT_179674 [Aspergillus ibericus CBS 121593]RAK97930.1 hypothetical protein BO80DRAFT_179674 [Aspergillus ibericus CBS 121593]
MLVQELREWRWRGRLARLVSQVTGGIPIVETPPGLLSLVIAFAAEKLMEGKPSTIIQDGLRWRTCDCCSDPLTAPQGPAPRVLPQPAWTLLPGSGLLYEGLIPWSSLPCRCCGLQRPMFWSQREPEHDTQHDGGSHSISLTRAFIPNQVLKYYWRV